MGGEVPAGEGAAGAAVVQGHVLRPQRRLRPLHQLRPHGAHPRQAQSPHLGRDRHRREGAAPGKVDRWDVG